jgi:DNA sulfur modification protein DndD
VILHEVVLHNFGVYRGRHTIDLGPTHPERPIVVIGALNGSGKTTLLDAIQLALYGPRARCSNRNGISYDEFLRRSIHRLVRPEDGAAVEVEFGTHIDGRRTTIRVHRSWKPSGRSIREQLDVFRDNAPDRALTDIWADYVEEFFPRDIARLFFFDGEKIEALADPQQTSELIGIAVHSLLGVDLIDQLSQDLVALQRRKRRDLATEEDASRLHDSQRSLEEAQKRLAAAQHEHTEATAALSRCQTALETANEEYRQQGGELYERRVELEEAAHDLARQLETHEDTLRDLAAEDAPLLLVRRRLERLAIQAQIERDASLAATLLPTLQERDAALTAKLRRDHPAAAAAAESILEQDRQRRAQAASTQSLLGLPFDGHVRLRQLLDGGLDDTAASARAVLDAADTVDAEIVRSDRTLAAVPDPARLEALVATRSDLQATVQDAHTAEAVAAELLARGQAEVETTRANLIRELDRKVEQDFAQEAISRVIDHADRVRDLLTEFRSRVLIHHIERIEHAVRDALRRLLHKDSLIADLKLDPETMTLQLLNSSRQAITAERLSAGERQLLAIAILWGLATVSGKTLPTVIDTPLSRLDGTHRQHLVRHYFPHASHQIILLSTDEEIDTPLLEQLRPCVDRTLVLRFDDATQSTTVQAGYFGEPAHAH